jgi:O-phospho-L-seryl-tRNASec:L-selenocysteinyl-tRNA synthase
MYLNLTKWFIHDSQRRNIRLEIDKLLSDLIPKNMMRRGKITLDEQISPLKDLMSRRRFPDASFSDFQIELLLNLLSAMDTDKDPAAARVGEREGRVASPLVADLAGNFVHGIGRSGHITAPQPKAAGASLMQKLANQIATNAIQRLGLPNVQCGAVLPLSTGMTTGLVMSALRREQGVKQVLYPRIDHKSPSRGINLAGVKEITIPTELQGDAVIPNMSVLEKEAKSRENCAILSTTTFFPPRKSDPVKEIAKICSEESIPHVINNAYGIQSREIMKTIMSAIDAGRVDAVLQSTDKNFLAPVGGAIVVTSQEDFLEDIVETYAGRGTAAPIVQALAALLALGLTRYETLRDEQEKNRELLEKNLRKIAESIDQRILDVENPIACAITMDNMDVEELGGRLYNRRVTGPRAVKSGMVGSCFDEYPHDYLVMNAAIGASQSDIEQATTKLYKELKSHK